jgi:POT family proton-dependent oligopeptide transporter
MQSEAARSEIPQHLGHPAGLFVLFFAEMWERFSYYGMRALLVFYMIKGFLSYDDKSAYAVYGAYTALVYMTPFFGGMIADRLLGARRAVILGGLLMAAGHLVMTVENSAAFYVALALLVCGNGFFKPNISTIVGTLYPEGSPKRDGGFTIFYMGINLGAAMAPLLCGYVGERFGWHYGFGLATVGMLVGLATFVLPTRIAQVLVGGGAVLTAAAMVAIQDDMILLAINGFVAACLVTAGVIAFVAMGKGGVPEWAGAPPDPARLTRKLGGVLPFDVAVYLGAFLCLPLFGALISMNRGVRIVSPEVIEGFTSGGGRFAHILGTFLGEIATPTGLVLFVAGGLALGYLLLEAFRSVPVERERLFVVLILMFFSMLFWAFFEQAGSSINNFTDRNVDRVNEERQLAAGDVGQELSLEPNQELLGHTWTGTATIDGAPAGVEGTGKAMVLTDLDGLREKARKAAEAGGAGALRVTWKVDPSHTGMGIGGSEVPASTFQAANPIFILGFGLVFTWLWGLLARKGWEPNTAVKFGLGLLQLAAGFGVLWLGAQAADPRGMVGVSWLLLGYLLHTTGELCLSPVGLSMVTRLSPARLVSTAMGAWFLATSFSSFLAAIIAQFTGVGHGGGEGAIPVPKETVAVYGDVFGQIALAATVSAVLILVISPILHRWMHEDGQVARGAH